MKRHNLSPLPLDMQSAKSLMDGVSTCLNRQGWFKQNWLVSVHCFPPLPQTPVSVTMHVFRSHWLNEDGQGIHFEAQFGPKQWAKLEIPVMLHFFHSGTIPGTKIKRMAVTKPLVDSIYDLVSSWPGYSFRVGRYGAQSFSCTLHFVESLAGLPGSFDPSLASLSDTVSWDTSTAEQFQGMVSKEISRLCIELGPAIDHALAQALK